MFNTLWHKVFDDILASKTRTIIVVLSIAVGVFGIGTIATSWVLMNEEVSVQYSSINPATAILNAEEFDEELVGRIEKMDEVKNTQARFVMSARVKVGDKALKNIQLYAIEDYDGITINKITGESGAWPPPKGELLLETTALPFLGVAMMDTIIIETPDGKEHEMRVGGVAHDLFQVPASWQGQAVGFITFDTLAQLGQAKKFNQLLVAADDPAIDKEQAESLAKDIKEDHIENRGVRVLYTEVRNPGEPWFYDPLQAMLMLMLVLGAFTLILSSFQVVNTISALLKQQVRQIGVMKSLGGRAYQIIIMYLGMVLIYGCLALAVAAPLGALGGWGLARFTASLFNFNISKAILPLNILALEAGISLILPLAAALLPIVSTTRISIREAISDYGMGKSEYRASIIDKAVMRVKRISRPLLLSFRNTFRHKWRVALTMTTLVLGGAILIAVLSVQSSCKMTLNDIMLNFIYDVGIDLDGAQRSTMVEREAMKVSGVKDAESWNLSGATYIRPDDTENEGVFVIAPPAGSRLISPVIIKGRWLAPGDRNAVVVNSSFLKDEPDVGIGDAITLKFKDKEIDWEIVGVATAQGIGALVYVDSSFLSGELGQKGLASRVVVETTDHEPAFQTDVAKRLEKHFRDVNINVSTIDTNTGLRARIQSQFDLLVIFLLMMAILLSVVGGLGLMGTMSLNVLERTKEIGVMRAVGASDLSVQKIVITEGVIIGFISWSLGALLALPVSRLLSYQVGTLFLNSPLTYRFSISGALIWLAISSALAALASFLPARRASKVSIREVLAYE